MAAEQGLYESFGARNRFLIELKAVEPDRSAGHSRSGSGKMTRRNDMPAYSEWIMYGFSALILLPHIPRWNRTRKVYGGHLPVGWLSVMYGCWGLSGKRWMLWAVLYMACFAAGFPFAFQHLTHEPFPLALIIALLTIAISTASWNLAPPAVLYLSASGPRSSRLVLELKRRLGCRVTYLLDPFAASDAWSVTGLEYFPFLMDNLRTRNFSQWRDVVHRLAHMVPIIVLDLRLRSVGVDSELKYLLRSGLQKKCLAVSDEEQSVGDFDMYSEDDLGDAVEIIIQFLLQGREIRPTEPILPATLSSTVFILLLSGHTWDEAKVTLDSLLDFFASEPKQWSSTVIICPEDPRHKLDQIPGYASGAFEVAVLTPEDLRASYPVSADEYAFQPRDRFEVIRQLRDAYHHPAMYPQIWVLMEAGERVDPAKYASLRSAISAVDNENGLAVFSQRKNENPKSAVVWRDAFNDDNLMTARKGLQMGCKLTPFGAVFKLNSRTSVSQPDATLPWLLACMISDLQRDSRHRGYHAERMQWL